MSTPEPEPDAYEQKMERVKMRGGMELRAELAALKPRALQKRAEQMGVEEEQLDDAGDTAAIIALIMAKADEKAAEAVAAQMRKELRALKPRALQRRAEEVGVTDGDLRSDLLGGGHTGI